MGQGDGRFEVKLEVRLRDGNVLESRLEIPRGHPLRPLTQEALAAKFLECAAPVLGDARASAAASALASLEEVADVRELTELLRP